MTGTTSISLPALYHYLVEADIHFSLAVNGSHTPFWDVFMLVFSYKTVWVPFYVSLVWYLFRRYGWRFSLGCLLAVALVITLCDQVSSSLLRPMIARYRPCDPENPISAMVHLIDGYCPVSYSCPSAHAANTWALAFFLSYVVRRRWLTLALTLWAFVTCWSRLYLGVHFSFDLLAGMVVGLVMVCLVFLTVRLVRRLFPRLSVATVGDGSHAGNDRDEWVPIAVLIATVVVMVAYSIYRVLSS